VSKKLDEQRLIDGVRRGDREAQREVYSRTSERIYRLLLRMTRNPDDAFDLAQETYIRAFTHIAQFDGRSAFSTWLCGIAVHEGLQFLRRTTQRRTRESNPSAAPTDPASDNNQLSKRIDIEEALAAVGDEDKAILLLRYQEGLDYAAIAEIAGCPQGTVASRLSRARDRLRELLRASYGGSEENNDMEHQNDRSPACRVDACGIDSEATKSPGTVSQ